VISAVDSNVLLDVLTGDPAFGPLSVAVLRRAGAEGGLVACSVVWAEMVAAYGDDREAADALDRMAVELVADDRGVATAAGGAWRAYRRAGGPRLRVLADFLVAAHALSKADRLVTRDRGFYRTHFSELTILDPKEGT
jgi:hypothetical protein